MKCNNCGADFSEGIFCPECGTKNLEAEQIFQKEQERQEEIAEQERLIEEKRKAERIAEEKAEIEKREQEREKQEQLRKEREIQLQVEKAKAEAERIASENLRIDQENRTVRSTMYKTIEEAERARREHGAVDNLISQLMRIKSQKKRQKLLREFGDNIETVDARSRYEKLREKVNRKRPLSEVFCKLLGFVVLGSFIVFCIICMYDSESIIGQYLCIIWMLGLPVWVVWRIVIFVKSMRKDYYKRLKDI